MGAYGAHAGDLGRMLDAEDETREQRGKNEAAKRAAFDIIRSARQEGEVTFKRIRSRLKPSTLEWLLDVVE